MSDTEQKASPYAVLERKRGEVTFEAEQVLLKTLRGALDMSEAGNRLLAQTAVTLLSSRSRDDQSRRASRHSNFAMAGVLTGHGMTLPEALSLTMPDDPVAVALAARERDAVKEVGAGRTDKDAAT